MAIFSLFNKVPMTDPRERIEQELSAEENLVWADRPLSLRPYFMRALPIFLFGIPFFSFAVFWTGAAFTLTGANSVGDFAFAAFGIPFILVGAGLLASPLWALRKARSTIYAVTDQRLLILREFPSSNLRSWSFDDIGNLSRTTRPNGTGSVYFTEEWRRGNKGRSYKQKIGFLGIHDPKRLEETIRKLSAVAQ